MLGYEIHLGANKKHLLNRFPENVRYVLLDYLDHTFQVMVPVTYHLFTCSGVDVPALLEKLSISERLINPLRDSSAGYIALAYALYKVATPIRYTVTLGILYLFSIIQEFVYNMVPSQLCLLSQHL